MIYIQAQNDSLIYYNSLFRIDIERFKTFSWEKMYCKKKRGLYSGITKKRKKVLLASDQKYVYIRKIDTNKKLL